MTTLPSKMLYMVCPVGATVNPPVYITSSKSAAEWFTENWKADADGYHDWTVIEIEVDTLPEPDTSPAWGVHPRPK